VGKIYRLEDLRVGENNIKKYTEEIELVSWMWCGLDLSQRSVNLCRVFVTRVMKFCVL
jgi:hypothetical protein